MSLTLVWWFCVFPLLRMQGLKPKKNKNSPLLQTVCPLGPDWLWEQHSPSRFSLYALLLICRFLERERDKAFDQNEALHKGQPHMHLIGLKTQPCVLLSYFIGTVSNASVSQQVGIRAGVLERLCDKLPHLLNYSAETWSKSNPRRSKPFNKLLSLIQQTKCQAYLKCIVNQGWQLADWQALTVLLLWVSLHPGCTQPWTSPHNEQSLPSTATLWCFRSVMTKHKHIMLAKKCIRNWERGQGKPTVTTLTWTSIFRF